MLVSATQIATRLESTVSLLDSPSSSCNDTDDAVNGTTHSAAASLELRALSALMGQVVRDACKYVSLGTVLWRMCIIHVINSMCWCVYFYCHWVAASPG